MTSHGCLVQRRPAALWPHMATSSVGLAARMPLSRFYSVVPVWEPASLSTVQPCPNLTTLTWVVVLGSPLLPVADPPNGQATGTVTF
jgi:hypothetical protein